MAGKQCADTGRQGHRVPAGWVALTVVRGCSVRENWANRRTDASVSEKIVFRHSIRVTSREGAVSDGLSSANSRITVCERSDLRANWARICRLAAGRSRSQSLSLASRVKGVKGNQSVATRGSGDMHDGSTRLNRHPDSSNSKKKSVVIYLRDSR